MQRLNGSQRSPLIRVQVFHQHYSALLQRLLQREWQQALPGLGWHQTHWTALGGNRIAQGDAPPAERLHQSLEQRRRCLRVSQGTVSGCRENSQPRREGLERVAATTKTSPGDTYRIQHRNIAQRLQDFDASAAEFAPQERQVKANVMANENGPPQQFQGRRQLLAEEGLSGHHFLRDSCDRRHPRTDAPLRVDKLLIFSDDLPRFDADDAQLDDPMSEIRAGTGRFHVEKRQGRMPQRLEQGEDHPWPRKECHGRLYHSGQTKWRCLAASRGPRWFVPPPRQPRPKGRH